MSLLARLGDAMRGLRGWRRFSCAFGLGAISATAFAPLNFFPALLLALGGLAMLLDGALATPKRLRATAATGWAFAFGQFLVGLHWIVYPFMVDPDQHLWQLPFALCLLPAGLALFGAMGVLPVAFVSNGRARLLVLAISMSVTEWLRGHVLTGFPWNLPAYGWGASEAVMQAAALMGAYGLSLLTLLLGLSLAELTRKRVLLPGGMALIFVGLWGYGTFQMAEPTAMVPGVALRLVQPDVPQRQMRQIARNWQRLIRLSRTPRQSLGNPTHIIWPEAAAAFDLGHTPAALEWIRGLTARGAVLLTGGIRVESRHGYNSLYYFAGGADPVWVYDKTHLVPFGEYVPYPRLLDALGISQLTGINPLTPGNGPHRYAVAGAPLLTPLICYEDTFPGEAVSPEGRPGWFVNITDDSWFGPWAGPAQHLLTARMRAIEEGVPMARAANTGISAVIDARGHIVSELGLNQMGVLDAPLPVAHAPTLYARFGDWVFALMLVIATSLALFASRGGARTL